MPGSKITPALKKIILSKHKSSPSLGVREISGYLLNKYRVSVSKSSISKILKAEGSSLKKGPKFALDKYSSSFNAQCGLLLLKALDSQIGLFNRITQELGDFFPSLPLSLLKRFIIFTTFSAYAGLKEKELKEAKDFLRLAQLNTLPVKKYGFFLKRLKDCKPEVDLGPVKDNVRLVSTVRFNFNNAYQGFSDARLSTFWSNICTLEYFFLPLESVLQKLKFLIGRGVLIIGYTKSFDYLSPLVYNFYEGINSGIKSIDLINPEGKTLYSFNPKQQRLTLCFGYYPQILDKG
ncbi:MAG: hypothetical protein JW867_02015, partial [Candidatus Omnitrophica bacterium]|nr:hypothetical protein [Candidatus Omnitrophota bacterium]